MGVHTWKVDEHGWVVEAKSRLVARGFKQCEGVDFSETFAPAVSSSCVRLLSAIACEFGLDLCHFDVDQAFVRSHLDKDVFLRLLKGCSAKLVNNHGEVALREAQDYKLRSRSLLQRSSACLPPRRMKFKIRTARGASHGDS